MPTLPALILLPSVDPILAPANDTSVIAMAFEPIVGHQIPVRDRLYVVHAAVSAKASLTMMHAYNRNGVSSSLTAALGTNGWSTGMNLGKPVLVPVVSMRMVLSSLPSSIELWYLKTDLQVCPAHRAMEPENMIARSIDRSGAQGVQGNSIGGAAGAPGQTPWRSVRSNAASPVDTRAHGVNCYQTFNPCHRH